MAGLSDNELDDLARRASNGDAQAFAELALELTPRLVGFSRARFPGLPCEDLVQETWLRLIRLQPWGPGLLRLAFGILRNVGFNALRKCEREGRARVAIGEGQGEAEPQLSQARTLREECLEQLNEDQQAVLLMRYYEGRTLEEVAKIRGVKRPSVSAMHSRAILALRDCMERG